VPRWHIAIDELHELADAHPLADILVGDYHRAGERQWFISAGVIAVQ